MRPLRLLIAILGGYILASLITVTISLAFTLSSKAETVALNSMLGYIIWICLIVYAFSNVKLKNLSFQFVLLSLNLYLINTCLYAVKG